MFLRRLSRVRWEQALAILAVALLSTGMALLHQAGLIGSCWLVIAAFLRWAFTRRAVPSVAALMDLPPSDDQYPVDLKLTRNGVTFGTDTGVVSFNDGWLTYQGLRTEFAVQAQHVSATASKRREWGVDLLALKVSYAREDGAYLANLVALDRVDGVGSGYRKRFAVAARNWCEARVLVRGEAKYPPTEVHPAAVRFYEYLLKANVFGFLLMLGAALLTIPYVHRPHTLGIKILLVIGTFLLGGLLFRSYRWRGTVRALPTGRVQILSAPAVQALADGSVATQVHTA